MTQFETVVAAFTPRRTDDLIPGADQWIGRTLEWEALWPFEKSDGTNYTGEWAMAPTSLLDQVRAPFYWVPSGDLTPAPAQTLQEVT